VVAFGSPGCVYFRQALASLASRLHHRSPIGRDPVSLKDQPTKYATKTVKLTGVVTSGWGIPLMPFQLYTVDDGSGEITVLSRSGRTPARGTRVEVRGEVRELAVFGGRSLGLHLQEADRKIKS